VRKNVSKIACSYHAATMCAILVYGFLREGDHAVEKRATGLADWIHKRFFLHWSISGEHAFHEHRGRLVGSITSV